MTTSASQTWGADAESAAALTGWRKGIDARTEPNQEFDMAKGNNSHKKETKKPKKEKPKVVATRKTT